MLLNRYRITDAALRVGGVGSVGTRSAIALLEGGKLEDALILQQKEVGLSALEAYLPRRGYANPAERVVVGQRLLPASSGIFLGWSTASYGVVVESRPRRRFYRWLKVDSTEELETNLLPYGAGIALPIAAMGLFVGLRAWSIKVTKEAEGSGEGRKRASAGEPASPKAGENE